MSWLARPGRLLVAVALVTAVCRLSAADEYQEYPPPQPLAEESDQPVPIPQQTDSNWPGEAVASPYNQPGLVPAGYESQELSPETTVDSFQAAPAAAQTLAPTGPLPLSRRSSDAPSPLDALAGGDTAALVDAATSLGIVLGLFLLVAWAVRRGMPKGSGLLPAEAVEVLGRSSLGGRQQVHLVRCANKIVLLSVTPSGAQTLAEISDPAEVDRLHSVCQPAGPTGGLWRKLFGNLAGPSRPADYYTRGDTGQLDFRHLDPSGQHHA